jgi:hypothetical protein
VMANMPFGKAPLQILTDSTSPIGSSSKFSVMRMRCGSSAAASSELAQGNVPSLLAPPSRLSRVVFPLLRS